MKKALVLTFVLVLGLGVAAFAGSLSGSWESELSIGFTDVVITDPGATFTIDEHTYAVSQGTVTIGSQVVTGTYQGTSYSVTVPGGTYWVGPWDLTIKGGTYDVTDAEVTIPAQDIDVELPDCTCTVTVPEYSFEIPELHDKIADVKLFAAKKTIDVPEPKAYYEYSGLVEYDYVIQSGGVILEEGDGSFLLEDVTLFEAGVVPFPAASWDWNLLCWDEIAYLWLHGKLDVNLYPEIGKHLQVDFPPFEVKVKCLDLDDPWKLMLLGRKATGIDQNNNLVTIMLRPHFVELAADDTTVVNIPKDVNWAYTPEPFEGQHWLFVKIAKEEFTVEWPTWPRCCTSKTPRPNVTIGWKGYDTAVYQYIGAFDDLEAIKRDVEAALPPYDDVLDKIGFGFLNTDDGYYEVDPDGHIIIPQGDIDGTFLLGSYVVGEDTITIPERTATGTCEGELITITIPAQDITVTGQTVTILDQTVTVPADSIEIPKFTFTITIEDQDIDITVAGGTYAVSNQTVTIPSQTVTIPGWTQTITRIPTLGFSSTLIVNYTVCGWIFTSTSTFSDDGWTDQSFAAVGSLGALGFTSDLVFDPSEAAFTSWNTTASMSIAGVTFATGFLLEADGAGWTFGASGSAGACLLSATAYFNTELTAGILGIVEGDYCFCFTSVEFDISFPFACIDLVGISLGFSYEGFDGVTFSVTGVQVPGIAWLTFSADLTFDDGVTGKELTLTPVIDLGAFTCITLYYELSTGDTWIIDGIYFYGIELEYTWNGVTFTSLSAFETDDPEDLVLDPYWEVFTIASESDSCCGGLFDFSVATYFEADSAMLFDWGQSVVKLSIGLGSNYTGWTGLTVTDDGFDQWTLGFKVTW